MVSFLATTYSAAGLATNIFLKKMPSCAAPKKLNEDLIKKNGSIQASVQAYLVLVYFNSSARQV